MAFTTNMLATPTSSIELARFVGQDALTLNPQRSKHCHTAHKTLWTVQGPKIKGNHVEMANNAELLCCVSFCEVPIYKKFL